jgi:hypothetical protein
LDEETGYQCNRLFHLISMDCEPPGWPVHHLVVFWGIYDGQQQVHCREGQAIEFVERSLVVEHQMPKYLLDLWDEALVAYARTNLPS